MIGGARSGRSAARRSPRPRPCAAPAAGSSPARSTGCRRPAPSSDRSAAGRLWAALSGVAQPPRPAQLAALDACLVLLADHELAASTLAARVAASAWADPYRVVLAGLGPLGGALHGAAPLAVESMLGSRPASPEAAFASARADGGRRRPAGRVRPPRLPRPRSARRSPARARWPGRRPTPARLGPSRRLSRRPRRSGCRRRTSTSPWRGLCLRNGACGRDRRRRSSRSPGSPESWRTRSRSTPTASGSGPGPPTPDRPRGAELLADGQARR